MACIFHELYFNIRSDRISLLQFLLEGHDGLAVLSTMDAARGSVRILVPETRLPEFWNFLSAVSPDLLPCPADT